ncbi:uncharacterized protein [Choristoneura fumiferana]|uniref:uncharacterized protein n=1 Tax=Choristoneura fumiferana TaxID=7141 RepID=UPI003D156881
MRSAGNSAKTIVFKDIQLLTSPSLRYHPSRLVSCGTETIHDGKGHSKATSVEKIVLYSDTGTNAVQVRSKKSFTIEGSGSLEAPNLNAKHYVPASINTDTSKCTSLGTSNDASSKLSSLGMSKKSSRPVALIDVCVQHNYPKDKPIKAYRSAAIVCSKVPSICKTEAGTSTTELNAGMGTVNHENRSAGSPRR